MLTYNINIRLLSFIDKNNTKQKSKKTNMKNKKNKKQKNNKITE